MTTAVLIAALWSYMLPSVIAFLRHHRNRWPVFLGNLLLGWSGIVWIVCLIFSVGSNQRA